MSKHQIAKEHLDEWNKVTGFVAPETGYYYEIISVMEDAMQEHINATLDELKEKVEELVKEHECTKRISDPDGEPYKLAKERKFATNQVLQLIEEAKQ